MSAVLNLIPSFDHCSRLTNAVLASFAAQGEEYVRGNIAYCLAKHNPGHGKRSLGGMIVAALETDYAKAIRGKVAIKLGINAEARQKVEDRQKARVEAEKEELRLRLRCDTAEGKKLAKQFSKMLE